MDPSAQLINGYIPWFYMFVLDFLSDYPSGNVTIMWLKRNNFKIMNLHICFWFPFKGSLWECDDKHFYHLGPLWFAGPSRLSLCFEVWERVALTLTFSVAYFQVSSIMSQVTMVISLFTVTGYTIIQHLPVKNTLSLDATSCPLVAVEAITLEVVVTFFFHVESLQKIMYI